jgi:hypothetical protein
VPPCRLTGEEVAKHNLVIEALRALNWTEETKTFGAAWCSAITSTASQENALMLSTRSVESKGMIFSVAFTSPTKRLSIDQTKALLDNALGRQH